MTQKYSLGKILFITNIICPNTIYLFNKLYARNVQIHVIYCRLISPGRQYDSFKEVNHPYTLLKEVRIKNHLYFNYEINKIIRLIKKSDTIIIGQYSSPTYLIATIIAKVLRKKIIFWSEAITKVEYEDRPIVTSRIGLKLRTWFISLYRKNVDELWPIGIKSLKAFRSEGFVQPYKFFFYYSDLSAFQKAKKNYKQNERFTFIFVGSLIYRKGFDLILKSVEILNKKNLSFTLHVFGEGPLKSNEKNIIYHGYKPHNVIIKYLSGSDIFLFPSRYDGWGVALIESLAAGVPVITSKYVGASEVIQSKDDGIVLKSLSVEELAETMVYCINNKIKSPNTGLVAENFTAEKGYQDFIKNIL